MIEVRLQARGLDVSFASDAPRVCLFGPSGSGKTTCLEAIAGLLDAAHVRVGDRALDGLPPRARRVGYVPQDAPLFPHLTVRENLCYGAPDADPTALAASLGVADLLDRRPHRLSGGERRRVALGRALLVEPDVLLLDEPFTGLDAPLRAELVTLVATLTTPVVLVSHDARDALALADEVVRLEGGRVVETGPPEDVFGPQSALVEPAALWQGTVAETHAPYATVDVGGCAVDAYLPGVAVGDRARLALRADEVTLAKTTHDDLSARNQLEGTIATMDERGAQVLLTIEAGVRVYALLEPRSAERMGLTVGTAIVAQFKASSVKRAGV